MSELTRFDGYRCTVCHATIRYEVGVWLCDCPDGLILDEDVLLGQPIPETWRTAEAP